MKNKQNILIIMSDQHNSAVLGCAGDAHVRTPNLDRLASEGVRFSNAYTPSPLCVPARMSFMTSKRPSSNRVWDNMHILTSGALTWAHQLSKAGYETQLIGRMHFEGPDQHHGFQKRLCAGPYAVHPGMHHAFPVYKEEVPEEDGQDRVVMEKTGGKGKGPYEVIDEKVTNVTCEYLRKRARITHNAQPFAIVAGYLLPHCPFVGDPKAFDYYYARLPSNGISQNDIDRLPVGVKRYLGSRDLDKPLHPTRVRSCQAAYYAMVESMDRMIGDILNTLDETGLCHNTIVLYVSDHGEQLNMHGCWGKGCYYESSVGIPMIIRRPGQPCPGSVCSSSVSLIDIGPTIIEMAGAEALPYSDGISMLPLLENPIFAQDRPIFSEMYDSRTGTGSAMLRKGRWKLWQISDDSPDILFDLDDDPDEEKNYAEDPDFQCILKRLQAELRAVSDVNAIAAQSQILNVEYAAIADWAKYTKPMLPETESVSFEDQSFELV